MGNRDHPWLTQRIQRLCLLLESHSELGLQCRKAASVRTGAGVRSHVCEPRLPWERPPPHPQELSAGFIHFTHPTVGTTRGTGLKRGTSTTLCCTSVWRHKGRGSLHDSGHSCGFGDFGTSAELWISAHYHKRALRTSETVHTGCHRRVVGPYALVYDPDITLLPSQLRL